ncbi:hypothetical protein LCGC14_1161680 [marine sediment metagenome]
MVTDVEFDEDELIVSCIIEAVITKRSNSIDWHELKNDSHWIHGWK